MFAWLYCKCERAVFIIHTSKGGTRCLVQGYEHGSSSHLVQSLYNTILIGMNHLIIELWYKGTILQRYYRKMTMTTETVLLSTMFWLRNKKIIIVNMIVVFPNHTHLLFFYIS